ncbi:MAG: hypothetical protein ACKVUS_08010 [Saprospiraceae bacterium]
MSAKALKIRIGELPQRKVRATKLERTRFREIFLKEKAKNRAKKEQNGLKTAKSKSKWDFFELPLAQTVKTTLILWHFLRQLNHP